MGHFERTHHISDPTTLLVALGSTLNTMHSLKNTNISNTPPTSCYTNLSLYSDTTMYANSLKCSNS